MPIALGVNPTDPQWIGPATALGAVLTAFAAVIVSPIISLIVTRSQSRTALEVASQQIKASVVSANRQAWINNLRDAIAEFLGALTHIEARPAVQINRDEAREREYVERVRRLRSRIALMINPQEEDHRRLLVLIDTAVSLAPVSFDAELVKKATQVQQDITEQSQRILKREWERVKSGEATGTQPVKRY
jgi:hypothetical protein